MLRTVRARLDGHRRLYLIDERCDFVEPVKLYLDHLAALEKSPHTLENYCRHLARYFVFLECEQVDWRSVGPDDLVHFIQWLRDRTRRNESYLSERTVNTIVAAVSSFYRYHIQRGTQLENPVLYEQISHRFSRFKRFLVHWDTVRPSSAASNSKNQNDGSEQSKIAISHSSSHQPRTCSSSASCC